jgi:hypothetical protein
MHESKNCPRCNALFECKPGNITQCHCTGVLLTAELRAYIEQRYSDCLCNDCLRHLQQELNLFREKYLFGK